MEVEREVTNLYQAIFMKNHIGDEFSGRITGMSSAGIYVSVLDPCVDVMIAFDQLGSEAFEVDEQELGVIGVRSGEHLMLGDEIRLVVIDVGIERRTVYGRRLTSDSDEHDFIRRPPRGKADRTFRNRRPVTRGGRPERPGAPSSITARRSLLKEDGPKRSGERSGPRFRDADERRPRTSQGTGKSHSPKGPSAKSGRSSRSKAKSRGRR